VKVGKITSYKLPAAFFRANFPPQIPTIEAMVTMMVTDDVLLFFAVNQQLRQPSDT
jgi:hypothetical protein